MVTYVLKNEKFRYGVEKIIGKLPESNSIAKGSPEMMLLKDLKVLKVWMRKVSSFDDMFMLQWLGVNNGLNSGVVIFNC